MTKDKEQSKAPEEQENAEKQEFLVLQDSAVEESGLHRINQNAISRVVRRAVTGVEGVARFAPKGAGDLLTIFTGKAFDSSMKIDFHEGVISLTLSLNLYYGVYVPKVLEEVRKQVIQQMKDITGAVVDKVDILVSDLVEPEEAEASPEGGEGVVEAAAQE